MIKSKKNNQKGYTHEITNVRDINNSFLYTKDNHVMGYLRIMPSSIKNMTDEEKASRTNTLTSQFKSVRDPFTLYYIPRYVDMDAHLRFLVELRETEENMIKRDLLNVMIQDANKMIVSGNSFEHQYYIKSWNASTDDVDNSERILQEKLNIYQSAYNDIGNMTEPMDDNKILKLCNLFANGDITIGENNKTEEYIEFPFIN